MSFNQKHLNIFYPYETVSRENNLTRALTIIMKNNKEILNEIFKLFVLDNYDNMFSLDFNEIDDEEVEMIIQTSSKNIEQPEIQENGYKNYIGVLITKDIINIDDEKDKVEATSTENPIPDMVIGVKDTLVIVEAKLKGSENNLPQLKGHVERIIENMKVEDININYKSITWNKILGKILPYYNPESEYKPFINDFIHFTMNDYTSLLPVLSLSEIDIEDKLKAYQIKQIKQRLEVIKTIVTQEHFNKDTLLEKGNRSSIPLGFGWAKEGLLSFDENEDNINIRIYPADIKRQGRKLYKDDMDLSWIKKSSIHVDGNEYDLSVKPYMKFANWNQGVGWIKKALIKNEKYKETHNKSYFDKMAGRWYRKKGEWDEFEKSLDELLGKSWRSEVDWEKTFVNSGKTIFDLSFGFEVIVSLPLDRARKLDNKRGNNSLLAKEVNFILQKLKKMIGKS